VWKLLEVMAWVILATVIGLLFICFVSDRIDEYKQRRALNKSIAPEVPKPIFPPRISFVREDGPPFIVGDIVFLKNSPSNIAWLVESISNGNVSVVRESGKTNPVTQRQLYPEQLLIRLVYWTEGEPEPPKRSLK